MTDETNDFTVPSDPDVRKNIRQAVVEASAVMAQIELFKGSLKDIVARVEEELEVPKKIFTKMAKAYHKQSYAEISHESEVFGLFYENIMEDSAP